MSSKIFISHNSKDKPVVEPIALRLADIFGEDAIFYDSWSIKPGDGIIDQMNKNLDAKYFFFFVSKNSLNSEMVKLEWQNALIKSTKGQVRIIPVRIDKSDMPNILMQTIYIDAFSCGIEPTIRMMVDATQEKSSFRANYKTFSNLSYTKEKLNDSEIKFVIKASNFMEPHPVFLFTTLNLANEIDVSINRGGVQTSEFKKNVKNDLNGIFAAPLSGGLAPSLPLIFTFSKTGDADIDVMCAYHETSNDQWSPIPISHNFIQ